MSKCGRVRDEQVTNGSTRRQLPGSCSGTTLVTTKHTKLPHSARVKGQEAVNNSAHGHKQRGVAAHDGIWCDCAVALEVIKHVYRDAAAASKHIRLDWHAHRHHIAHSHKALAGKVACDAARVVFCAPRVRAPSTTSPHINSHFHNPTPLQLLCEQTRCALSSPHAPPRAVLLVTAQPAAQHRIRLAGQGADWLQAPGS